MPDLLTHFTVARLTILPLRDVRVRLLFYGGTFLPDVIQKFLKYATYASAEFTFPTHTLLGPVLFCYIGAMLFAEELRKKVFWALLWGSYLHIFLDLFKYELGEGVAPLFFPLVHRQYEFGLYVSEDIVYVLPLNLLLLIGVEFWMRRRGRVS